MTELDGPVHMVFGATGANGLRVPAGMLDESRCRLPP